MTKKRPIQNNQNNLINYSRICNTWINEIWWTTNRTKQVLYKIFLFVLFWFRECIEFKTLRDTKSTSLLSYWRIINLFFYLNLYLACLNDKTGCFDLSVTIVVLPLAIISMISYWFRSRKNIDTTDLTKFFFIRKQQVKPLGALLDKREILNSKLWIFCMSCLIYHY